MRRTCKLTAYMTRIAALVLAPALIIAVAAPAIAQDETQDAEEVSDEKLFYVMGTQMYESVRNLQASDAEIAKVIEGFRAASKGTAGVDPNEYRAQWSKLQKTRMQILATQEAAKAEEFLAKMEKEPGATKSESGLIYTVITEGSGDFPKATDQVKVHYHGTLRDGLVFDSSVDRGEPLTFPLNRVIPCWTEGVAMMKPGGKSKFVCPPRIAYGDQAAGKIPPGSALVFEVELIEIIE